MRKDLHIYNEATGFVITSKSLNGRLKKPIVNGPDDWRAEVMRGTFIPLSLAQDDPINVRVVVDEPLTAQEEDEAWDRFDAMLAVPDGKLAVIGGAEYLEEPSADHIKEYGQLLKIPAGNYAATVLTYYHSPNALIYPEIDMAAFFNETRRKKKAPLWIDEDADDETDYISFVLHLRLVDSIVDNPIPIGEEGWVPEEVNMRRPDLCPLGLVSKKLFGKPKVYKQTSLNYRFKVFESVSTLPLTSVDGGPVTMPVEKIVQAHWIGFMTGETHPALRVTTSEEWKPEWPGFLNGVLETRTDDGWTIEIEGMNARWSPFRHMRIVGDLLGSLPDGSIVEADWGQDELRESGNGMLRLRGPVTSGQWSIAQTYPSLTRDALAGMLDFAAEAEAAQGFMMPTESARDAMVEHCRQHAYFFKKVPPAVDGLRIYAVDEAYNAFLAAQIFQDRFKRTLPIMDWDD